MSIIGVSRLWSGSLTTPGRRPGRPFHCVLDSILLFAALVGGGGFGYVDWVAALAWSVLGNIVGGVGLVALLRLARVPHRIGEERARMDRP